MIIFAGVAILGSWSTNDSTPLDGDDYTMSVGVPGGDMWIRESAIAGF